MSYAHARTTNNVAEYGGLLAGLWSATQRRYAPLEVIGDSGLILTQVQYHRPPRNASLLALYRQVRPLADILRIQRWTHHLRAYKKTADAAANLAMDNRRSLQTYDPAQRREWTPVLRHLAGDHASLYGEPVA
ncbi:hypothetical protein ATCC90586_008132 [Pythium insidiosum]|nr:hypothetical protein ATCC90586_008132 [Pythium insidiosum]